MAHDLAAVFDDLRAVLSKHADRLIVQTDRPHPKGNYSLNCPEPDEAGKAQFFASVMSQTTKVGFYFMPISTHPALLEKLPPELKAHLDGKSCFHFVRTNPELLGHLDAMIRDGLNTYAKAGFLGAKAAAKAAAGKPAAKKASKVAKKAPAKAKPAKKQSKKTTR